MKRVRATMVLYRGYELWPERHVSGAPDGWAYAHKDYDGPPDRRCGWSKTFTAACQAIRELEEDLR